MGKTIVIYQNKTKGILIEKNMSKDAVNKRWVLTLYTPSTNSQFFGSYLSTKYYTSQNDLKKDNKDLLKDLF